MKSEQFNLVLEEVKNYTMKHSSFFKMVTYFLDVIRDYGLDKKQLKELYRKFSANYFYSDDFYKVNPKFRGPSPFTPLDKAFVYSNDIHGLFNDDEFMDEFKDSMDHLIDLSRGGLRLPLGFLKKFYSRIHWSGRANYITYGDFEDDYVLILFENFFKGLFENVNQDGNGVSRLFLIGLAVGYEYDLEELEWLFVESGIKLKEDRVLVNYITRACTGIFEESEIINRHNEYLEEAVFKYEITEVKLRKVVLEIYQSTDIRLMLII